MPFKSAELKDLVERAWGLGAQVTASTLARWFRAGELMELVDALAWSISRIRELEQLLPELERQLEHARAYQEKAVDRINHFYNIEQELRRRLDGFLQEYDELQPKYEECIQTVVATQPCVDIVERFEWLRDTAIPGIEYQLRQAINNGQFWREEYKRMNSLIPELEHRIESTRSQLEYEKRWLREKWRMVL